MTYNACSTTGWNNGVSFPIKSGHGCIGCSEKDFWDKGPFYKHLSNLTGFGVEADADELGLIALGAAGAGVAAHAALTEIRKPGKEDKEASSGESGHK